MLDESESERFEHGSVQQEQSVCFICIVLYRNLIILLLFWLWPAAKIQSEKLSHEKAGSFSVLLETD